MCIWYRSDVPQLQRMMGHVVSKPHKLAFSCKSEFLAGVYNLEVVCMSTHLINSHSNVA